MNNNSKENRKANLYVTLLVILMMIAVVVAIAGAVVRNVNTDTAETTKPVHKVQVTERADTTADASSETKKDADRSDEFAEKDGETKKPEADTTLDVNGEPEEVLPQFINPTGGVVMQNYSMDVPVFSPTMNDYRTHKGVDISVGAGDKICAAADGVIGEVWDDPMMGKCLSITHAGGGVSTYSNLSEELPAGITAGTSVKAGDIIAAAGESALAEIAQESHLHFELQVNGVSVNPADYIDFSGGNAQFEDQ